MRSEEEIRREIEKLWGEAKKRRRLAESGQWADWHSDKAELAEAKARLLEWVLQERG